MTSITRVCILRGLLFLPVAYLNQLKSQQRLLYFKQINQAIKMTDASVQTQLEIDAEIGTKS